MVNKRTINHWPQRTTARIAAQEVPFCTLKELLVIILLAAELIIIKSSKGVLIMGRSMFGFESANAASRYAYDMMVLEEIEKENRRKRREAEEQDLDDFEDEDIEEEDF